MTNKHPKEIEYGVKIKNSDKIIAYLVANATSQGSIETAREVYKKDGSKYFFRTDRQRKDSKKTYMFSVKEDILVNSGVHNGIKISDEVDVEVSKEQLGKLKQIIILLGYSLVTTISKTRRTYNLGGLMVTIDSYPDSDYLEIEGESEKMVMDLVEKLPIEKLGEE